MNCVPPLVGIDAVNNSLPIGCRCTHVSPRSLAVGAVTIMNMLIGVLCEVITAVAAAEKEAIQVNWVKDTLSDCLYKGERVDTHNDRISKCLRHGSMGTYLV